VGDIPYESLTIIDPGQRLLRKRMFKWLESLLSKGYVIGYNIFSPKSTQCKKIAYEHQKVLLSFPGSHEGYSCRSRWLAI
jgi:hypothetical protein